MGQHQPLPAALQLVLRAGGGEHQAAAPLPRLQQQVDLRIVAQGLKVADALHRGGDGLPVADGAGAEGHLQAEPLPEHPLQDLQLDLPHQLDVDLPGLLVPGDVELGVLLFQLAELLQGRVGVHPLRQQHLIGQHRLQGRGGPAGLDAQALPRPAAGEARHSAHRPRRGLLHRAELGAGVDAELVRLLLPHLLIRQAGAAVGQQALHPQGAAGDF